MLRCEVCEFGKRKVAAYASYFDDLLYCLDHVPYPDEEEGDGTHQGEYQPTVPAPSNTIIPASILSGLLKTP